MDFSELRKQQRETRAAGRKVEKGSLAAPQPTDVPGDALLSGIVKVKADGYLPRKVHVRARLGDRIFTAEFLARDLADIQGDPNVETVSVSKPVPLQKRPEAR